jgi:glycosyltransferase involved in cell wall biosynthesis
MRLLKNIRVLHISSHKTWRGGEQQATYLLHELRKQECSQWVLCSKGNAMETYCEENGVPYYTYKKGFINNFINQKNLFDIVDKHHIQLIHCHDSHSHTLAFISGIFGLGIPVIVSRRVDFEISKSWFSKKKYNAKSIVRFICVSEKIKEILSKDVIKTDIIKVVHSGIDLSKFDGKKNQGILREEYNIPENVKIIGNVAALAPHKDYFTFVDTAEKIIEKNKDVRFLIIGKGELENEIKTYIRSKSLLNYITLTGFRNDIPDILPELDLFLFTSKTEGLGTSILDALGCNVPVVATNAGGIPEIIIHEQSGLLADIGNAEKLAENALRVLEDDELRKNLVEGGNKKVQEFTIENTSLQTLDIYKKVIAENEEDYTSAPS